MALDPNLVGISDVDLLMYYYFDSTPVSGVAIPNRAENRPTTREDSTSVDTSLTWHSDQKGAGGGISIGTYGVNVTSDVERNVPPQWDGVDAFAASGNEQLANTLFAYHHKWRIEDNLDGTSISEAMSSGSYSIGGWFKTTFHHDSPRVTFGFSNDDQEGLPEDYVRVTAVASTNRLRASVLQDDSLRITFDATSDPSGTHEGATGFFWRDWQHIALTVSHTPDGGGDYAHWYQNGIKVGSSSSSFWATELAGDHVLKFFAISAPHPDQTTIHQGATAFRDYWMFKRSLTEGEVIYIFNHDISHTPVLRSDDNDMLLWYRFVETSGQALRSWAYNTPTGTLSSDPGIPVDTHLYHYNDPDDGISRITMLDMGGPGSDSTAYPPQWENQPDQPKHIASGNTLSLYHALRGEVIDDTSINQAMSGDFTIGFWVSYATLFEADQRYLFSFDRGSPDPGSFALGFNMYTEDVHRFGLNIGAGSNKYIYNNTLDGNGIAWNHLALTKTNTIDGDGKYARIYINGQLGGTSANPDWDNILPPYYLTFFNNHNEWEDNQFRGAIKDFVFYDSALSSSRVQALHDVGVYLITSTTSGTNVGGYALGRNQSSGNWVGGYATGFAHESSGNIGGYYVGKNRSSGQISAGDYGVVCGGWYSGLYGEQGTVPGFVNCSGSSSGFPIGSYLFGFLQSSGAIASYLHSAIQVSGLFGCFVNGSLPGSGVADASFVITALVVSDVDALIEVKSTDNGDFDASIEVYKSDQPPSGLIVYPATDVTGEDTPYTPWFVGSGTPYGDQTIVKTIWNFGDLTPEEAGTASGVGVSVVDDHTYTSSGVYIANFRVLDSKGLIGNATRIIDLSDGTDVSSVELSAVPQAGNAPLTVDFDYTITNVPDNVTITSKVLYFGNGQSTLNPNVTYTYKEPGVYTPVLCVLDSRGVIVCDSLEIGVNN